jgi:8-oxo-dGTP pyrophosphatase MutT (NUDIX family)
MLGEFEYLLITAAARLGEEAYGAAIRREIEEATGTRCSNPCGTADKHRNPSGLPNRSVSPYRAGVSVDRLHRSGCYAGEQQSPLVANARSSAAPSIDDTPGDDTAGDCRAGRLPAHDFSFSAASPLCGSQLSFENPSISLGGQSRCQ